MPAQPSETTHSDGAHRGATPAPWFVHPDDLVGGWAVMNVDKPPSQCNPRAGEGQICDFTSEADARLIVELRNRHAAIAAFLRPIFQDAVRPEGLAE
jgi:hypothetical protein